ncbi:MAG: hypothetical protein Q4E63_07740 [Prevotellaceae bacterium]|nr:hypothetical protein [Prevotellaceae bacterium]MDO4932517.1 hypothetical protein [Prevotellaceae bacterium]
MTRFLLLMITAALVAAGCGRPAGTDGHEARLADSVSVLLPHSPGLLYDQGRTSACWIYAMCACIEHEAARRGDSVTLSRQWLMGHLMEEQAMERYDILRSGGKITDGGRGTISMTGVGPDALRLIAQYGLVPYMHERRAITNSSVLERKLSLMAASAVAMRQSPEDMRRRMKELLPTFTVTRHKRLTHDFLKPETESFYYLSMRYTPQQFAESVMYYQTWRWYASEDTHPWGAVVALEVSDNRRYHEYRNLPMRQLLAMVRESLGQGHAVYWEYGCEPSHQKRGGGAASDHAVAIIGMVDGKFLCLNSYGPDWGMKGCRLVSEEFFMKHTSNVGIIEITE